MGEGKAVSGLGRGGCGICKAGEHECPLENLTTACPPTGDRMSAAGPHPKNHLCTARRQKGSKITRELSTSCAYVGFRNNTCNFCNPTMGQNTKTTTAQRKSNSRVMVVVRSDPNLPFQEKVEIKPGTIAGTTSKNQTQIYRSGKEPEKQAKPAGCSLSKPRPASTKCYLSPACR